MKKLIVGLTLLASLNSIAGDTCRSTNDRIPVGACTLSEITTDDIICNSNTQGYGGKGYAESTVSCSVYVEYIDQDGELRYIEPRTNCTGTKGYGVLALVGGLGFQRARLEQRLNNKSLNNLKNRILVLNRKICQ